MEELRHAGSRRAAGAAETSWEAEDREAEVRGKILEYAWWMKKNGYADGTIEDRVRKLRRLVKLGADLLNPESVKEVIARQPWKTSTKKLVCDIYGGFARFMGLNWVPPSYKPVRELPFIPTEREIDALIAGSPRKLAALLQLLKETGMRIGEAVRLRWIDIDPERRTVRVRPEKGSNPRIFKVSEKLMSMLGALPRRGEYVFDTNVRSLQLRLWRVRRRIAQKLQNPRILRITFHTIRHWKATMLYHQTKDILYVKDFLGHKSVENTMIYVNIERALFGASDGDEFTVRIARTPDEIKQLLEAGFEYVCEKDGLLFFRKRK